MELSELTNKELKGILRENDVRNYSKLNKKDLVKKVNKLLNSQIGGKIKYKKNNLKKMIGGEENDDDDKQNRRIVTHESDGVHLEKWRKEKKGS